jgi:hypothetical protein
MLDPELIPPVVVKTIPEAGSSNIDFGVVEVRVTFSKPMQNGDWTFYCINQENKDLYVASPRFDSDGRTFIRKVKLQPDTTYAFAVNSKTFNKFKDTHGNRAIPYTITFKTKAK